jgi:hypothetical protein
MISAAEVRADHCQVGAGRDGDQLGGARLAGAGSPRGQEQGRHSAKSVGDGEPAAGYPKRSTVEVAKQQRAHPGADPTAGESSDPAADEGPADQRPIGGRQAELSGEAHDRRL